MRNTARLEPFYEELKTIHERSFPDWRFGQFMYNFMTWLQNKKDVDPFHPEEPEMLEYLKEFEATFKKGAQLLCNLKHQ